MAKQARLPGVETPKLQDLEDAAEEYVEIRDRRIALTDKEVDAKGKLLNLMKKHDRKRYKRGPVSIEVVPEGEKVKVKIDDE
jgi:hypothetical protein